MIFFCSEFTAEPKAFPERPDRKAGDGKTEVGYGVQGLPGICGWIHEHAGESNNNAPSIKVMSHTMKLRERVVEATLRTEVRISEQQYGFMPNKCSADATFALRMLIQKVRGSCIVSLLTMRSHMTGCQERSCGFV